MPTGVYKRIKPAWNKGKHSGNHGNGFKKGNIPWDKKLHIQCNTGRTHFKKGHKSWNKGKKETRKEVLEKISIGMKKRLENPKNHPNWKGGKSFEPYSVDWTETLKRAIKERDHYICQLCKKQEDLTVHHTTYEKKDDNPEHLITLCRSCNSKVNFNRNYWIKYFQNIMEVKNNG